MNYLLIRQALDGKTNAHFDCAARAQIPPPKFAGRGIDAAGYVGFGRADKGCGGRVMARDPKFIALADNSPRTRELARKNRGLVRAFSRRARKCKLNGHQWQFFRRKDGQVKVSVGAAGAACGSAILRKPSWPSSNGLGWRDSIHCPLVEMAKNWEAHAYLSRLSLWLLWTMVGYPPVRS